MALSDYLNSSFVCTCKQQSRVFWKSPSLKEFSTSSGFIELKKCGQKAKRQRKNFVYVWTGPWQIDFASTLSCLCGFSVYFTLSRLLVVFPGGPAFSCLLGYFRCIFFFPFLDLLSGFCCFDSPSIKLAPRLPVCMSPSQKKTKQTLLIIVCVFDTEPEIKPHKRASLKAFVTVCHPPKNSKKRRLAGGPGLTFADTLKEKEQKTPLVFATQAHVLARLRVCPVGDTRLLSQTGAVTRGCIEGNKKRRRFCVLCAESLFSLNTSPAASGSLWRCDSPRQLFWYEKKEPGP